MPAGNIYKNIIARQSMKTFCDSITIVATSVLPTTNVQKSQARTPKIMGLALNHDICRQSNAGSFLLPSATIVSGDHFFKNVPAAKSVDFFSYIIKADILMYFHAPRSWEFKKKKPNKTLSAIVRVCNTAPRS